MNLFSDLSWTRLSGLLESVFVAEIYRIQGYDVVRTSWTQLGIYVLAVFMMLLAAWQGALAAMRWVKKPSESSTKLLSTLIRSHHLSKSEIKLLTRLAKRLPASVPPTALFIDRTLWDDACSADRSASVLELRRKLFEAS